MLMSLRQSTNKTIVKILLFGLLIVSFGLWGVADLFIGNTGVNQVAVSVGERDYTVGDVEQNLRRDLAQLNINRDELNPAILSSIMNYSLQRLVSDAVQMQEIEKLNVRASDAYVAGNIRENPAFRDGGGNFDRPNFNRFLGYNGLTEQEYINIRAKEFALEWVLSSMVEVGDWSNIINDASVEKFKKYYGERRAIEYISVPLSMVNDIPMADEAVLKEWFNERVEGYRLPEYRDIRFVDISRATLENKISISEDEMKNFYDERRESFSSSERREIEFLIFDDEASANIAHEKLKNAPNLQKLADADDIILNNLGMVSKGEVIDPALADAAFSLNLGEVSSPIQGTFGWLIAKVKKIEGSEEKTFADVRQQVRQALIDEKIIDVIYARGEILENAISQGMTLVEAANEADIEVYSEKGLSQNSSQDKADIVNHAFTLDANIEGPLVERNDGSYFMVLVDNITPSRLPDFEMVKEDVAKDWLKEKRLEFLQAEFDKDKESSFTSLQKRWKLPLKKAIIHTANPSSNDGADHPSLIYSPLIKLGKKGDIFNENSETDMHIARISDIYNDATLSEEAKNDNSIKILQTLLQREVLQAYMQLLQEKTPVIYNNDALETLINDEES